MPKQNNAPEAGIERGGKRKKALAATGSPERGRAKTLRNIPKNIPATDARSAETGEFVTAEYAKRNPSRTVVERRKGKRMSVDAWALQDKDSNALYLAYICATRKIAKEHEAELDFPCRTRIVRVRIEVCE